MQNLTQLVEKIKIEKERALKEIAEQEEHCRDLDKLRAKLEENRNVFDSEDIEQLELARQARMHEIEKLKKAFKKKEEHNKDKEELWTSMKSAIEQRSLLLEEANDCLTAHPQMTRYFAKKQNKLKSLLGSDL